MPSLQQVLTTVAARTMPTRQDRVRMDRLSSRLVREVQGILDSEGFSAEVSLQGSVAKDTWLRDEADLDIFMGFPATVERAEWNGKLIPALRKGLHRHRTIERFAEHPYVEFHVDGVRVNVVPCYKVTPGEWKSATDRTPFHTEYMRTHLTAEMRREVRVLKKFMKGIGVYGAEIRVGGFSGMLAETLILNYASCPVTLQEVSEWNNRVLIQVEKTDDTTRREHFDTGLVVTDPVDPNRNLAAAVRADRQWSLVAAAREFLREPNLRYFYPPAFRPRSRSDYLRSLNRSSDLVAVVFPHPELVVDVLWGQLLSLERSLLTVLQRFDFKTLHSQAWSDERRLGVLLFEVESSRLSQTRLHLGPPVGRVEESEAFLKRHSGSASTASGPFVQENKWVVEKRREYATVSRLLKEAIRDPRLGLSIPQQLKDGFSRRMKILENQEVLRLGKDFEFGQVLWEFLNGRPQWLRPRPD